MNKVFLTGRLARDPEVSYTPTNNTAVCRFTIAVDRVKEGADFIRITVWGKQAESCGRYLVKGRQVAVDGRIQVGSYDKNGEKVYTTDVVAERVEFLGSGNHEASENAVSNKESYHNYGGFSETPTNYRRFEDDLF